MSGALQPQPFDEISAKDALAYQFQKLGLEFSSPHPAMRSVAAAGKKRGPVIDRAALIGDPRNDENLIIDGFRAQ